MIGPFLFFNPSRGPGLISEIELAILALMKTATLTEAKNRLSALIDQVCHGETILILDRGRAVARLTSVLAEEGSAPEGRVERLERQGILRRAQAPKSLHLFHRPRPNPSEGGSILEALLEERRSGR